MLQYPNLPFVRPPIFVFHVEKYPNPTTLHSPPHSPFRLNQLHRAVDTTLQCVRAAWREASVTRQHCVPMKS